MPLNVNLNLSGSSSGLSNAASIATSRGISIGASSGASSGSSSGVPSSVSGFANVNGSTTSEDVLSLLDKYNSSKTLNNNMLYSSNDLLNQISTNSQGCKTFNINDYTDKRVSSCNCKL